MAISDQAIRNLPLGKDVEQVITDCMQDWSDALQWALEHRPDPPASTTSLEWGISLIGNMLWAVTVFFPPAFAVTTAGRVAGLGAVAYAQASASTKVASVLGAAIASNSAQIGGVLRTAGGEFDRPDAKTYFHEFFSKQVGQSSNAYVSVADEWARTDLLSYLISQFSLEKRPNPRVSNDEEFRTWYFEAVGSRLLRTYTWEQFIFPHPETPFIAQQGGLEQFLVKVLKELVKDLETQWARYAAAKGATSGSRGPALQFQPTIKYSGMPREILDQHEKNRIELYNTMFGHSNAEASRAPALTGRYTRV